MHFPSADPAARTDAEKDQSFTMISTKMVFMGIVMTDMDTKSQTKPFN